MQERVSSSLLSPVVPSFRAISDALSLRSDAISSTKILPPLMQEVTDNDLAGAIEMDPQSCIVESFRFRTSLISSPLWTPQVYGPTL